MRYHFVLFLSVIAYFGQYKAVNFHDAPPSNGREQLAQQSFHFIFPQAFAPRQKKRLASWKHEAQRNWQPKSALDRRRQG